MTQLMDLGIDGSTAINGCDVQMRDVLTEVLEVICYLQA